MALCISYLTSSGDSSLFPGNEKCAQGGPGLPQVEGRTCSRREALVVPGAEHPAHDGPAGALAPKGRFPGERGRELHDGERGERGERGQQLNTPFRGHGETRMNTLKLIETLWWRLVSSTSRLCFKPRPPHTLAMHFYLD